MSNLGINKIQKAYITEPNGTKPYQTKPNIA